MSDRDDLEQRFERYVEHHVVHGGRLDPDELCRDRPQLAPALRAVIERYHRLDRSLGGAYRGVQDGERPVGEEQPLPGFEGFRTVERIGRGGMGDVYKVRDMKLERFAAAKVLRRDRAAARAFGDFLAEARSLALFNDPRIVQVHEVRPDADPPVILMEYVEGFELGRVAPSLELRQRARIMADVCRAVQRAHDLGIQHRDLKPSNILLDESLSPKILDFGLAGSDPDRGHGVGTVAWLAPEQLDPARSIDARSDVHALGAVFYKMLCGRQPYDGEDDAATIAAIRAGRPALPAEIDPDVPEPLQAIALKAMEPDPERRYAGAGEMALDLARWLDGRPVLARPGLYGTALRRRLRPHLDEIREWLRLRLIYPHEASRLEAAYRRLEQREDDWILESRKLTLSQITLYTGVFLLLCGGMLYFIAHRFFEGAEGLGGPLAFLGLPMIALNVAGHFLARRDQKAVAVAYWLAGALVLPLFLLIVFHEAGWWSIGPGRSAHQILEEAGISNRQLQISLLLTAAWSCWLALRTRTVGLSALATAMLTLAALSVLADFGLDDWLMEGRWDLLALHLAPLPPAWLAAALVLERRGCGWFARPLFVTFAVLLGLVLELLALDGRAFDYLGITLRGWQGSGVSDPVLLDTLAAMTLVGVIFLAVGALLESRGSIHAHPAAWLLVVVSPFATLHPIGWLVETGEYSRRWDWFYLVLALGVALSSRHRQRKSFFAAGVLNAGVALLFITDHYQWFDHVDWAVVVLVTGLLLLAVGYLLFRRGRGDADDDVDRAEPGAGLPGRVVDAPARHDQQRAGCQQPDPASQVAPPQPARSYVHDPDRPEESREHRGGDTVGHGRPATPPRR